MTKIVTWETFELFCREQGREPRVISQDEHDLLHGKNRKHSIIDDAPPAEAIERGNRVLFEKYCKAEGIDPAKTVTSPILAKLIADQDKARAAIDAEDRK